MSGFHYHPLAQNKKQIRLLTVKPALLGSDVECDLQAVDLDESISYDALSYVWGDNTPPGRILLQGTEHRVTPNLESALRHLRYEDRPRLLWVDAVCINQNDIAERTAQVQMMANIYSKAKTTVSWLGEAANESDGAVELIRKLGDWVREHEGEILEGEGEEPPSDGSIQTAADFIEWLGFPLRSQNWPALWRFLERPYWTRVWIIQELAVRGRFTKASGIFYCGTTRFERTQFDHFCGLILFMITNTSRKTFRTDTHELDEPLRSMLTNGHPPGLTMSQTLAACTGGENRNTDWLLRVTARFKATDPRDKLYALLGMAQDGNILKPDYSTSYEQVLMSFVSSHIERYKSLRVLLGNRYREMPTNPSWVPDLLDVDFHGGQGLIPAMENDYFQAAGTRAAVVSINATLNSLSSLGVFVGEIDKVIGPLMVAEKQFDPASQNIQSISTSLGQDKFFEALRDLYKGLPESDRETFWRTLCLNGDWTGEDTIFPAPADFALKQQVAFGFKSIPVDFMPGEPEGTRYAAFVGSFIASLQTAMSNRTFITTQDGRMGAGPFLTRAGDVIVVMFGAPFCLILRPVGHQYQLVGDAYVHGIMHGELVEGLEQDNGQMFEII
ncbi:Heterokaryon incompatibility protein 6, OR allele [Ilyonectria robusta]